MNREVLSKHPKKWVEYYGAPEAQAYSGIHENQKKPLKGGKKAESKEKISTKGRGDKIKEKNNKSCMMKKRGGSAE